MHRQKVVAWILVGLYTAGTALAQQDGGDLAAQARDPTAALTMLQFRVDHISAYHNLEGADQTRFVLQPIIPFKLGEQRHIARVTLPYVAAGPDWGALAEDQEAAREKTGSTPPPSYVPTKDKTGLGDTSAFDFLIFDAPWKGRYFLGLSTILPTATDPALGTEKWSLGPAAGALVQAGPAMFGGIALSNFSVAGKSDRDDVSSLGIQLLGSYGFKGGWSLELSEVSYNYDFNSSKWTSVPLGGRIGKMATIGKQPVRFYADAEYNFVDDGVAPEWTFRFAVVPLL